MDRRYTVFVSSTYKDLVDARWAVARALMRLNLIPLGMEAFTASDKSQWEIIKKTIDLSDYYVLILGNCYGSIDTETGMSFTEKEYRYALEQGIPCLTFVSKDVPIRPEHRESDDHRGKLNNLRAEVSTSRLVDFWTNADDLTGKVATALVMAQGETPRPGWIRNPQTTPDVAKELARLSLRNAELEGEIRLLRNVTPEYRIFSPRQRLIVKGHGHYVNLETEFKISNLSNATIINSGMTSALRMLRSGNADYLHQRSDLGNISPHDFRIVATKFSLNRFEEEAYEDPIAVEISMTGRDIVNPIVQNFKFKYIRELEDDVYEYRLVNDSTI